MVSITIDPRTPLDRARRVVLGTLLERLLIVGQYPKNDIWRKYERSITIIRQLSSFNIDYLVLILTRIYTLLQLPNENTNSLNNEHVNKEQRMIDSSSII
ncbi:unnamed protein product [Rotaria sp. Silwood1]|nr:unnamed protein product [Rotaria sp. Silwood1]